MTKQRPDRTEANSSEQVNRAATPAADWRVDALGRVRSLIHAADAEVVEEMKWRKLSNAMRGIPVWSHDGIICTGEIYKDKVKLTFAKGAQLADGAGLFNASLDGGTRRAIDLRVGQLLDPEAFTALVRAAVALNTSDTKAKMSRGEMV